MNFSFSNEQKDLITAISNSIKKFDDNYWLECDNNSTFPHDFVNTGGRPLGLKFNQY